MRVIGAVALLLTGCVAAMPAHAQSDWDSVTAAAKREGRVVVYNSYVGVPELPAVAKLFEARYGIPVDILDGRPSDIAERVRTEVSANRVNGDLTLMGVSTLSLMSANKLLVPPGELPNWKKLVVSQSMPEDVPIFVSPAGILTSNALVPDDQIPKKWTDLLDPKWKGKIISDQMSASGIGQLFFSVMLDTYGEDFHKKLQAQDLHFSRNLQESARRVARGEFSIFLPLNIATSASLEGLPIKVTIPEPGAPYTPFSLGAFVKAPHPNAARLFMNFYLEDEAQMVYVNSGIAVATGGHADKVPEQRRWSVNAKLLGRAPLDKQNERMKLAAGIYDGK